MLAHFTHHLLTTLPVPMLPFIRSDFNLDYTQSAMVVSAFTFSYGLGQLPAGWLADRVGPRILITIGICGVALAGVLVGLSQTYMMMLVFLVLMGLTAGGYHPSAAPLISTSVEPEKRGRALGIHLIGGGGSFFLAPLIAAAIAAAWGWRASYIGLAVPTVIFGIFFYQFLGRRAKASQAQQVITSPSVQTSPAPGRLRRLVAFMVLSVTVGGVITSVVAFIPLYMVDHFGTSEQVAASFMAVVYSAGLWAGPAGGYLADRTGKVKIIVVISVIAGVVIYLLNLAPYGLGIGALLFIVGVTIYARMSVSEVYIIGHTTERRRSVVYGIYYSGMMEAGAIFAPIMGSLIDRFGFYTTFNIASVTIIAVTLICSGFLWGSWE